MEGHTRTLVEGKSIHPAANDTPTVEGSRLALKVAAVMQQGELVAAVKVVEVGSR